MGSGGLCGVSHSRLTGEDQRRPSTNETKPITCAMHAIYIGIYVVICVLRAEGLPEPHFWLMKPLAFAGLRTHPFQSANCD